MKHPDGLEVFLQTRVPGSQRERYTEVLLPGHDPKRRRCCVPASGQLTTIQFRFDQDFDMCSGNAVELGVCYNRTPYGNQTWFKLLKGQSIWKGKSMAGINLRDGEDLYFCLYAMIGKRHFVRSMHNFTNQRSRPIWCYYPDRIATGLLRWCRRVSRIAWHAHGLCSPGH